MDGLSDLLESQLKDCHNVLEITKKLLENLWDLDYRQLELFLNQRGSKIEVIGHRFKLLEKLLEDRSHDDEMGKWIGKIRDEIEEILTVDEVLRERVRDRSLYILKELERIKTGKKAIRSYHEVEMIPKFLDKKI